MQALSKYNSIYRIFVRSVSPYSSIYSTSNGREDSPFGNMQRQYLDCMTETCRTISTAEFVGAVGESRSGGSLINVLVTARADLEIDLKLYPPC